MRRLTRLREAASSITPACSSNIASPASTPASTTTCLRRRDYSCVAQRPRVSTSAPSLPSRTWGSVRPYSNVKAPRKRITDWVPEHEVTDLSEVEPLKLDRQAAKLLNVKTDLKVPGEYERYPLAEHVTDPDYVPAETTDGLEWVGGLDNWWEDGKNWPASMDYAGFGRTEKITDPAVLEVLVRRAVVEALAVSKGAGEDALRASWPVGGSSQQTAALEVGIEVSEDGAAELTGDATTLVEGLTTTAEGEQSLDSGDLDISPEQAREFLKSWDRSWKQISLEDPRLRFAVTRRIQQLTGHVVSDSRLIRVRTVSSLLETVVKPAPPKKLAELVEAQGTLNDLPNVKFYPRRVTPIDKEKMVGRWKLIVRELEKRELPVTGTGGYEKSAEKKWASGKS